MRRDALPKPVMAGAVVLCLIVAAAAVFLTRGGSGDAEKPKQPVAAVSPETEPQAEEAPPETVPSEKPTVKPYATKLSGQTVTPKPDEPVVETEQQPAYSDGCDRNYGDAPLCVPYVYPQGFQTPEQRCKWLKDHGFPEIPIRGQDRQGLDPDKNGVACDDR